MKSGEVELLLTVAGSALIGFWSPFELFWTVACAIAWTSFVIWLWRR